MQETRDTQVQLLGQEAPWRMAWQFTPVFLGESYAQRSLVGHSPQGRTQPDMTEVT